MSQITFQPARVFATLGKRKETTEIREAKKPKEEEGDHAAKNNAVGSNENKKIEEEAIEKAKHAEGLANRGRQKRQEIDELKSERKINASPLGRTSPINRNASREDKHRNGLPNSSAEAVKNPTISVSSSPNSHTSIEKHEAKSLAGMHNVHNTKASSPTPLDTAETTPLKKKPVFGSALGSKTVAPAGFANITTSSTFSELLTSGSDAVKSKITPASHKASSVDEEAASESEEDTVEADESQFMVTGAPLQKIQHSTGEESEECISSTRAKLFMHDNQLKEWKERGVGNIKCLKRIGSDSTRLGNASSTT